MPCCTRGTGARGLGVAGPFSLLSTVRGVFVPCAARRALRPVGASIAIACVGFSSEARSNKGTCHCTRRFWPRSTVTFVEFAVQTTCTLLTASSGLVGRMCAWCPVEAATMCSLGFAGPSARSRGLGAAPAARGVGMAAVGPQDALVTLFSPQSSERKQEIGGADGFSALSLACGRRCDRGSEQQVCKLNFQAKLLAFTFERTLRRFLLLTC